MGSTGIYLRRYVKSMVDYHKRDCTFRPGMEERIAPIVEQLIEAIEAEELECRHPPSDYHHLRGDALLWRVALARCRHQMLAAERV